MELRPLDAYAVPHRRRSPRAAVVFLPLTLGLFILVQLDWCAVQAIPRALRLCFSKFTLIFFGCCLVLLAFDFYSGNYGDERDGLNVTSALLATEHRLGLWAYDHLWHGERLHTVVSNLGQYRQEMQSRLDDNMFPASALRYLLPLCLWPFVVAYLYAFIAATHRRFSSVW